MAEGNRTQTGAGLLVRRLHDYGVRHVFGYPGGPLTPLYDAKARAGALTPAEQAEVEAYSRVGCLIGILHSQARRVLKGRPGTNGKAQPH
jgi:hypothetical protein